MKKLILLLIPLMLLFACTKEEIKVQETEKEQLELERVDFQKITKNFIDIELDTTIFPNIEERFWINTNALTVWKRDRVMNMLYKAPLSIYVQNSHLYIIDWENNKVFCESTIHDSLSPSTVTLCHHVISIVDHPYEGVSELTTSYVSVYFPGFILLDSIMGEEFWIEWER